MDLTMWIIECVFGLCLPYRAGWRPAVECVLCAYGSLPLVPLWDQRLLVFPDLDFIYQATT